MKTQYFVLPILLVFVFGVTYDAYATTYHIKIPSGASDPDAPYFWSEKSTGVTTGEITVYPGDTVSWENADTVFHTITSVTQEGEINGLFESGLFSPGKSFEQKFTELGDFYYFCSVHPWMNGVVHVVKNPGQVKTLKNVGSGLSDTGVGYEVKYILDTNIQTPVTIEPTKNTLTFKISGDTTNDQITLILPPELIENPNTAWVDGVQTDFTTEDTESGVKMIIPIAENTKEIKIMGTHVVPEFGFLAMGILSASILSVVVLARSKFIKF